MSRVGLGTPTLNPALSIEHQASPGQTRLETPSESLVTPPSEAA